MDMDLVAGRLPADLPGLQSVHVTLVDEQAAEVAGHRPPGIAENEATSGQQQLPQQINQDLMIGSFVYEVGTNYAPDRSADRTAPIEIGHPVASTCAVTGGVMCGEDERILDEVRRGHLPASPGDANPEQAEPTPQFQDPLASREIGQ